MTSTSTSAGPLTGRLPDWLCTQWRVGRAQTKDQWDQKRGTVQPLFEGLADSEKEARAFVQRFRKLGIPMDADGERTGRFVYVYQLKANAQANDTQAHSSIKTR